MPAAGPIFVLFSILDRLLRVLPPAKREEPKPSVPQATGPQQAKVIAEEIIPLFRRNMTIVQPKIAAPPGWLGGVNQYGQLVQSSQFSYLVSHTDPYWDAGGSYVSASSGFVVDDRTSEKVLACGHVEPPCPFAPTEWIPSSAGNLPRLSRKGASNNAMHGGSTDSWNERLARWTDWFSRAGHEEQRRNWIANFRPVKRDLEKDAWVSRSFRSAVWLVWAMECVRVRAADLGLVDQPRGTVPGWWSDYCNSWGIYTSKRLSGRSWSRDLPYFGKEPWEATARRLMSVVGWPGQADMTSPKWIANIPRELSSIAPILNFSPPGVDWFAYIESKQAEEWEGSAAGKAFRYYKAAIGIIVSVIAARFGAAWFSVAWTTLEAIPTMVQSGLDGRWKDLAVAVVGEIEKWACQYSSDARTVRNQVVQLAGQASGVLDWSRDWPSQAAAQDALSDLTERNQREWGWTSDLYGGGALVFDRSGQLEEL